MKMIEFCFDCEMRSSKFIEKNNNYYCEECWYERFYIMKECKYCEQKDYELEQVGLKLIHTIWDTLVCSECYEDNTRSNGGADLYQ
jgi:hypothetical protein